MLYQRLDAKIPILRVETRKVKHTIEYMNCRLGNPVPQITRGWPNSKFKIA